MPEERMRLKNSNKRLVLYIVIILLIVWGIRGFLNAGDKIQDNSSLQEKLILSLETEVARLRHQCDKSEDSALTLPTIYAITPTHQRPVQKAELTRISHTLMLVPNLHWIIVEDSEIKTELVAKLLAKSGLKYTHINANTPKEWKLKSKDPHWSKPRGVIQRNAALQWIRDYVSPSMEGVIYFLDDDNTYSLQVFHEMRYVKGVGVWPVGLVGGLMVERPKVNIYGKIEGWLTVWGQKRPFAIDMAGFAVNLGRFFQKTEWEFAYEVERGYQESVFLQHFVRSLDELEVKADNCTKVYVWHTRTEAANLVQEQFLKKKGKPPSNLEIEV